MNNINIVSKDECCGCSGCKQICPKSAITMIENEEGFKYPKINIEKCINCGLCKKICPVLNYSPINKEEDDFPIAYAAKNQINDEILKSSSGGIFTSIANYILSKKGIVYGAAYVDKFSVKHIRISNRNELFKLQGSKYVQSDIDNIYKYVKEDLENDFNVLFSGTPCQVKGLYNFLKKDYKKLITCDLVCHGVPSQKIFNKYINYLENKYNKKIKKYDFRNKEKRGWSLTSKITFEDNTIKYINSDFDPYYDNFLNCNIYRESCYNCKFCNIKRCSDITLADYWGILSIHNEFYNEKGVSLILINTKRGADLFNKLNNIEKIKTNLNYAKLKNKNLIMSSNRPKKRNNIYDEIENKEYIKRKLKYRITLKKIMKIFISNNLKQKIKKYLNKRRKYDKSSSLCK